MNGQDNSEDRGVMSGIRAMLALMFGAAVCWGFLFSRVGGVPLVSPDTFSAIAMAVILWWFKERSDEKRNKETAAAIASAVTPIKPTESTNP